jgi:hypothetical protein
MRVDRDELREWTRRQPPNRREGSMSTKSRLTIEGGFLRLGRLVMPTFGFP